jgi:ABC-2 type transport system permease protein
LLLARRVRATVRQPVWVIGGLATPRRYWALFAPLLGGLVQGEAGALGVGGGRVIDAFLPGMLVLFAYGTGTGIGWTVIGELERGVIERFRVTPIARSAVLVAGVAHDCLMFVLPAGIVVGIAATIGFTLRPAGILGTVALCVAVTAMTSAASAALGLTLKNIGALAAVVTGTQLPLTLLAGVLLPISLGPTWLRVLAHVDPLYYATQAAREMASGHFGGQAAMGWAVIVGLTGVSLAWAKRVYERAIA